MPHTAKVFLSTVSLDRNIPIFLTTNETVWERATKQYESDLPPIIDEIRESSTPASLEINFRRLVVVTLEPWTVNCAPRPNRFRPGWSEALDQKAKTRWKLSKPVDPATVPEAKRHYTNIKRTFRTHKRRIQKRIVDDFAGAEPRRKHQLVHRAISVDEGGEVARAQID